MKPPHENPVLLERFIIPEKAGCVHLLSPWQSHHRERPTESDPDSPVELSINGMRSRPSYDRNGINKICRRLEEHGLSGLILVFLVACLFDLVLLFLFG